MGKKVGNFCYINYYNFVKKDKFKSKKRNTFLKNFSLKVLFYQERCFLYDLTKEILGVIIEKKEIFIIMAKLPLIF